MKGGRVLGGCYSSPLGKTHGFGQPESQTHIQRCFLGCAFSKGFAFLARKKTTKQPTHNIGESTIPISGISNLRAREYQLEYVLEE